jgi:NADH-quinone oxidoreductase subunit N
MDTTQIVKLETLQITSEQLGGLLPYLAVFVGTLIAIVIAGIQWMNKKGVLLVVSLVTLISSAYFSMQSLTVDRVLMFSNMMVSDSYGQFFNLLFAFIGIVTLLLSTKYLDRENLHFPEFYILVLFSVLGMMFLANSLDLIVIFIALEIMSLSVYVLVGFRRSDRKSNEAAMKYFILGAVASAILLYGSALLYGATGTLNILDILKVASTQGSKVTPMFVVGSWLAIIGFLFKVAAVPFHMWMPDVYEGAPTPVTGFMTTGVKAASFAVFVRVLLMTGYGKDLANQLSEHYQSVLWVIAAATMLIGNVIALTQMNLKRMLAYSSIAHTGYLILGMMAGPYSEAGFAPVVLYLASYSIMNLGAFGILTILSGKGDTDLSLQNLAGLSKRHPWLAFALAIFMFSMAGIPPTAGFASKYFLLYSAVQAKMIWLAVVAVLCSAISVYYYLRVLVFMYMRDPAEEKDGISTPALSSLAVAMMVVLTLQVGILPSKMIDFSKRVIQSLSL